MDAITLEVLRNAFVQGAEEMKSVTVRTAYSPLWKSAGDVSCGILDATGHLVAQGPADIPVQLGSMPMSMQGILARIPADEMREGDAFLQNDPFLGNNHLPDAIMAKPVFVEGRLVAFTAVRGHYIDIGGLRPGSYSPMARDIHGEGLRIPPVRIFTDGVPNRDVMEIVRANTRMPGELIGDIRAQYAGCVAGERRIASLAGRYGPEAVLEGFREVLDHSERLMRLAVAQVPEGEYRFADHCDDDGVSDRPLRIEARVELHGGGMVVDFTGTDPQVESYMNAPLAVTASATYYAAMSFFNPASPPNSGIYRAIDLRAPRGTLVNPAFPGPVAAGNHETANRIYDVVLGALAQASPERAVAPGAGSSCGFHLTGYGPDDRGLERRPRTWVEVHGASRGAGSGYQGPDALQGGIGNTANTPVERIEVEYPVLVERLEIAADSGGPGRWRGGCGIRRRVRVQSERASLTVLTERARVAPFGLAGGAPGEAARVLVADGPWAEDDPPPRFPGKADAIQVERGCVLEIQCAGGGGYGDPLLRDPQSVAEDVTDGLVSPARAGDTYGVVLTPPSGPGAGYAVDAPATRALRAELRAAPERAGEHEGPPATARPRP